MYLEPWSRLDSSLRRSKNLLLCSECRAKWRCCFGGLDGKGYWNRLGLRLWSIIAKNGKKATTSQQRSSGYSINILEKGNVFAISRSTRYRYRWCHYQASRLSSLSQVNDIALATRIWITFIWPLSGLAHRSQTIVLACGKAWPVDGGKNWSRSMPTTVVTWPSIWKSSNSKWTDGGTTSLSGSQPILS